MIAAASTKITACPSPICTHFIRVSERVRALISLVCGLEQEAATISYVMPAATRNATPLLPEPRTSGMSAADRVLLSYCNSSRPHAEPARRELVPDADAGADRTRSGDGVGARRGWPDQDSRPRAAR